MLAVDEGRDRSAAREEVLEVRTLSLEVRSTEQCGAALAAQPASQTDRQEDGGVGREVAVTFHL
jgi:hypothetical protein